MTNFDHLNDSDLFESLSSAPIGANRREICAEIRRRCPLTDIGDGSEAVGALRLAVLATEGTRLKGWGLSMARLAWAEDVTAVTSHGLERTVLEVQGSSAFGPCLARLGHSEWREVRDTLTGTEMEAIIGRRRDAIWMPGGAGSWNQFWLFAGPDRDGAADIFKALTP